MKFVIFLLISLDFSKQIALTFDDGPCYNGETLLDALSAAGVKATFFLVGENVAGYPGQVARAVAEGHEIGCHGWDYSGDPNKGNITDGQDAISNAGGGVCKLFRPPNLSYGAETVQACEDLGLPMIGSSIVAGDWDTTMPTATVVQYIVNNAHDGGLALLHWPNTAPMTAAGVVDIVSQLKAKGYDEFLTVSQLAAAKGVTLQAGKRYDSLGCAWLGTAASPTTCGAVSGCTLVGSSCVVNCATSTCKACDFAFTCGAKSSCEWSTTNSECINNCAALTCSACDNADTCAGKTGCVWDQSKCAEAPPASSLRPTPMHLFVMGIAFVIGASLAGLFA